ncbi:hypothetical protein EKL99_09490 [Flavobacterium sp. ZB4P23]|uniref:Uncharacterized protein n=1 Tax=Flavobacterium bomense TaxID=2497483 RepID=A0A432CNX1_9FLAO|nr:MULTISPECIES: hypothetical protein [Flavobacterium]RTY82184.1 hypothetical protein EKL99_09490 [Flavobacterium sp. ZB4P23]RTY91632.1 hypothetical protein EKM01_07675 [Flavobacterium sp. RSP46]RTZ05954.1 hypothetical protein EKL98_05325 [Flavobacterium bomense]RTZ07413.1 hypothetical protein EKM03_04625 [Flavobacterium sp. GSP6]
MKTFKLENEPKIETGFKIPDHYFENFSAKMMKQLPIEEPKVFSIFQKRKNRILMVAAILVIALMIPVLSPSASNPNEIDTLTLENYLTYQSSVNPYDLISELETEDINNIKADNEVLEDEAIEDHLSENANLEHLLLE